MSSLGIFLAVMAVLVSALIQIFSDPRITRQFVARSLVALVVYAAHVAIAIVVISLLPFGPDAAAGVTVAVLGWIGLGALGLIRFAPRLREPPRVLLHFGVADILCLLMVAGGLIDASRFLS